ncbi:ricin B-like lectin R40G3 [Humulus lupulus]|uniref:ricin B-like lectin R40G3 n=1 Tax=Humulus lupulus TaxID=3486 RepID=UPI002B4091E5|nr:ricin B-like lectin R40G3 [Humulus lupulus]
MKFPYGQNIHLHHHHHHYHHNRRRVQDDDYLPPGTRPYDNSFCPPSLDHHRPNYDAAASTEVIHVHHHYYQTPPPPIDEPAGFHGVHHSRSHDGSHHNNSDDDLSVKPTVKVFSKAQPDYSLTIKDGNVILALSDPSDGFQHWYKDEKYSTRMRDEEGRPCFSLVNKATGQAIQHSIGETQPVQLIPYDPNVLDESILWTEGRDLTGNGFRPVRMVNNICLNMDAFHGDEHSGGVHDGTMIVLWKWNEGDNQLWRITPYCKFPNLMKSNFRNNLLF